MASLEEEVKAELEQERLAREKEATSPVNPVVDPAPVAQPPVQAANPTPAPVATPNDIYTEVNAEIEQERLASQQTPVAPAKPEEPKEPLYVTKFREYGPDKDDEDVKTSLELLTPEQRHDLLKSQPWAYTKFTPEQQEQDFEESRKVKPMSGEDIANIAGSLYGTGVEVAKSSVKVLGDLANVGILAPIQQAIKNKSFLEVKGENEIIQAAQKKLDTDARNLSGAIPASIIGTTRMIQKMLGGKDLNSIANPIQRAIATLAPIDLQGVVGQPIPDQNAGQANAWKLFPSNTGIIPLDLVTIIAQAASDKDAGGIAFLDRINERLGIADKDQSRNRDHIRKLYDAQVGAEDWKASNGQKKLSPWSQVAFSDVGQQAILFRERSLLPSIEFIAEHDGISLDQAQEKRNRIAEANAEKATTELTKEWNRDYDPKMEFLGSLFLGDAAFGEAGIALGAGKLASPLLQKASTLGMTEREVSRYYDALQKLEKAKLIARQKDMSTPSWWGKSAEYVEKKQEEASAAGQTLFENLPAPVKAAAPLAGKALAKLGLGGVGGGVGALLDPENPSVGMLQGLTLTTGLGVAPSVIRSVDRARRMIGAGEGKLFTEVAKSPESSLPARLIFNKATGPVIDYIAENSTALFKSGVNLGALSAVTSTLNSDDPEEFNQAVADGFGMGMGFHLAHGITGRIHGKDPAQDLKNRQKRDVEIFEAVKTASPATQGMLEQITNYQTAIDRVDALVARSETNLAEAMSKEDTKATKLAADALKNARALQKEVLRANVQTRNEYGRSFLSTYADLNRLANGSRRAGQPNISLEILSPEQITDLYVSENSRQGMTPDEIAAVRAQGQSFAMEKGYFDRANNRAVINAQHILERTTLFGESPSDALRHDGSHALDQIPEFQKLNEKTDKLLFTTEEKDLQGNVLNRSEGIYDDKALVDMYFNKYIGDRNLAEKIRFSEQIGLYNPETKQFNIPEIVKYMKSEVRAELSAGSLRSGLGKLMGAEATIANWVGMRQKQNLLARAIQAVTGLGGKPFSSSLLGIDFTPEVIAANKEAIKALADFNGRFDLNPEGTAGREMSEKEIRTSPVLRKRYGLSGGEFQTELKGVVRDANGKIVGTPVRVANPTAAEGNWTFDEAGNRKQTRGYGQVPDEFQGVDIPAGGSLEVYRDFVYEPDGKTPVATKPNDLANLETERGNSIRQALTDAVYDDSTTRLAPFSADGLSWSGVMSKSQVQAIKSIPESILPLSIKEKILAFNDTMARGDGSTFDLDYAPRLGTGKKYKGRKSDIYHVIPIGFGFSKAGNFYLRSLSLNAAFRKLKARAKLMDGWLTPWDNNPNLFMKELQETYLNNTYEKRDGWLGLDPENPTEKTPLAEVKFGRFLDFMNMIGSDTPPNPQRAVTPADPSAKKRKTKAGAEEDNQGIDNLWRSFRLDAIADFADTTEQTGRYRIDLDRVYKALMPAEGTEQAPAQEERRPTPFDGITAAYNSQGRAFGASYVSPQATAPDAPKTGIQFMPASAEIREKGSKQQLEFFDRVLENSGIKDKPNTMAALDNFIYQNVKDKYRGSNLNAPAQENTLFPRVDPEKIKSYYQKAVRDASPEQAADFPPDWLRIRNMSQEEFDGSFDQDRVDQITQFRVNALAKSANYLLGEMKDPSNSKGSIVKQNKQGEWVVYEEATGNSYILNAKTQEDANQEAIPIIERRANENLGSYSPAEVAAILNASAKFRVNAKVNENGEMTPAIQNITNGNEAVPNEISGETASKIAEYMRMGMSSKDAYVKGLYDNMVARAKKRGVYTGWKKYDQSSDMGDAETLNADCAGTGWCTGGSVGTANSHLSGGDFYLYFENGDPQVAIRTNDGEIAEVRGRGPSQNITSPKYDIEAEKFIVGNDGPTGGSEYLNDRNFRKMAVEVMKTGVLPDEAYRYYDQDGNFMAPKPKMSYSDQFEPEYLEPFKTANLGEIVDSEGNLKTSLRYSRVSDKNSTYKTIGGDILGPNTIVLGKDWTLNLPNVESVKGGIIVGQAEGINLPKLEKCDFINCRNAVEVNLKNLKDCKYIYLPETIEVVIPNIKECERGIAIDSATLVDLPELESAKIVNLGAGTQDTKRINLPKLKTSERVSIDGKMPSVRLPSLEKCDVVYIGNIGDGSVYLPKLKTAESVTINSKEVYIPKLDISESQSNYGAEKTRLKFIYAKTLEAREDVLFQYNKTQIIKPDNFTFIDSNTKDAYSAKTAQDADELIQVLYAKKNGQETYQGISIPEILNEYRVDTQASRDRAQGNIQFMPKSEAREEERTERLPASGAELTASLVASGTSLESFGKDTLIQLAESYGIDLPKGAKRGEIIDAINERPQPVQATIGNISFMPKVAVVPERYTGTGAEEERRGKYVAPPKFMGAFNISQYEKGGKFFDAETGEDLTDKSYKTASISVDGGKPSLVADVESEEAGTGGIVRTNLFKQKAGWKWISEKPPETSTIVSVEGQGKHVYAMRADFQNGVKMARYPDKTSEPRLRPTGRGELVMGQEIGRIDIRGKEHPVYDTITIGEKPASDISFMPASPELPKTEDEDPKYIIPPNPIEKERKGEIAVMANAMKINGWSGRPLLVADDQALTGSHRLEAAKQAGILVPIVRISNQATEDFNDWLLTNPENTWSIDINNWFNQDDESKLHDLKRAKEDGVDDLDSAINLMQKEVDNNNMPKTEDGKVDWEGFKVKTQEIAKPLAGLSPIGGVSFMPAKKQEAGKLVDTGDETSLPVFQKTKNGKPVLKKGDPVYVQEKYNLVNAPAITEYNGPAAEDAAPFDFDSLAYDVTGPQQIKINSAIKSGAVDYLANQVVEKTNIALENAEIAAGKGWYSRMRDNLLNALGEEGRELLSQLLGATSAKTPVNQNFLQAMDAYEGMNDGRYDENRKSYLEMLAATENGNINEIILERGYVGNVREMANELSTGARKLSGKKKEAALGAAKDLRDLLAIKPENRTPKQSQKIMMLATRMMPMRSNGKKFNANSLAVLKVIGGTWLANRKSPKTPNFAGNLSGRTIQATIDVWAARFLRQAMYEGYGKPWRIQPKSETGVSNEDFALGQIILERAANKLGMNPDDLQAVLWFAEKQNWDERGWTKNEGAEKSSFDEIFHVFFPKGKKPLSFTEASRIFAEMKSEEIEDEEAIDEDEE